MTHDVFISYASDDKPIADAVCAALEQRQIHCWIAPREARPGLDYADSIIDALDETSVVVFIVSSRSIVSPHVKREVEHAASSGTHIIPFRVENVELSRGLRFFLGTVHWIDALTTPIDKHLDYLAETVQYFLDRKRAAEISSQVSPAAPALTPAPQAVTQAAAPAESPGPPAASTVTPSDRPSSPSGPAAPTAPPVSSPARANPPKGAETPGARVSEGIVATREAAVDAGSAPRPQSSSVATSGEGSAADGPSALRPKPKSSLWLVVGFGTVGAVLGEQLALGILSATFASDSILYKDVPAWTITMIVIVPAAIVTWAWLSTVGRRTLSPAVMGGLGGILGAWPSWTMDTRTLLSEGEPAFYLVIAQALQWAAFGVAGGLAAVPGRSARPAVSMSIALSCVCFVRTLFLVSIPRGRWVAFEFLLVDLLTAIGWGVGLIACPATTAALRQPQPEPPIHS